MDVPSSPHPRSRRSTGVRRVAAAAAAATTTVVAVTVAAATIVGTATANGTIDAARSIATAAAAASTVSRSAARTFTPQQMEGPFFLDTRTLRSDLTNGRPGVPLYLSLRVVGGCRSGSYGCQPRRGALVDVWHTDSRGIYSGFADRGVNATASDWMRGAAISRSDGGVLFRSIIPGWYPGRLAHVHVKVRLAGLAAPIVPDYFSGGGGGWRGFTTQLYLPDPLVRSVYAAPPYRSLWSYDSDVGNDIVLAGDAAEYAALTMNVWPATAAWVAAKGLSRSEPGRWGLGYVAEYTLRLMG